MESISTHWIRLWLCFGKDKKLFDSIKLKVIWKSAYKVKYIIQVNGGLILFFLEIRE